MKMSTTERFGLNGDQTRLLFSLQYHLIKTDIDSETDEKKSKKKQEWFSKWQESSTILLSTFCAKEGSSEKSQLFVDYYDLRGQVCKMGENISDKIRM